MKYFTKEWYELGQKMGYHLSLEEITPADASSEEFFQQLYDTELHNWLTLQEEVNHYMRTNEEALRHSNYNYEPFNRDVETERFHSKYEINKHTLSRELPAAIVEQVADLRILALNKATRQVISAIAQFCEDNEKAVNKAGQDYSTYIEEAKPFIGESVLTNFGFHDCTIVRTVKKDQSLHVFLDNSGGFTCVDEVIFEDFNITKQEGLLEDAWWLYEEVYKVHDKYEFHVLLQNQIVGLFDLIIEAKQVHFKRT